MPVIERCKESRGPLSALARGLQAEETLPGVRAVAGVDVQAQDHSTLSESEQRSRRDLQALVGPVHEPPAEEVDLEPAGELVPPTEFGSQPSQQLVHLGIEIGRVGLSGVERPHPMPGEADDLTPRAELVTARIGSRRSGTEQGTDLVWT